MLVPFFTSGRLSLALFGLSGCPWSAIRLCKASLSWKLSFSGFTNVWFGLSATFGGAVELNKCILCVCKTLQLIGNYD